MTPMVSNTLTEKRVEFVPKDGNTVRWYICGPTVYDSSHLGHARTYVAFDVIRRILESFFGYDIFCVMNVTDVDDKIILRARRNYLLKEYRESKPSLKQVLEDGFVELAQAQVKFEAKKAMLEAKAAAETRSGQKKGLEEEINGLVYKHRLVEAQGAALAAAKAGELTDVSALLDKVGDLISSKLDGEKGGEVRDQEIFRAHAAYYEQEYLEDMKALGVRLPDVLTRVTEFMPQIVTYIEKIISNGFAYATTSGDVYFDIRAFQKDHAYRKLSYHAATTAEQLAEGEGALSSGDGKKHENDFALWKSSKPGEPAWDSPWGGGRPGWHIECSVMASDVLGDTLDIHGGGIDLCFPHHDNELAQAEAYYGHQQWVNYFLHSGHLYIGNQKMSKSLKNFFTIRELLKGGSTMKLSEDESITLPPYTARQLRIVFMMHEWDKPMYFSKDALDIAVGKEKSFKEFFGLVKSMARDDVGSVANTPQAWNTKDMAMNTRIEEAQRDVTTALCDNFNTPTVLLKLQDLVTGCNVYVNSALDGMAPKFLLVNKAALYIAKIFRTLGIDDNTSDFPFLTSQGAGGDEETLGKTLDTFCALREEVRASARSKADAQWFSDKVKQVQAETMAPLHAEAASKVSVLPKVLAAMDEWVAKVGAAAAAGKEASAYLDLCDQVRDDVLPPLGVRLEDKPEGYVWKLDDPKLLALERAAKMAAAEEAARKKLENKLEKTKKELDKWLGLSVPPADMFKSATDKYSKFDEQGIPTHTGAGEELSKKQRQGAEKDFNKRTADFAKLTEQGGETFLGGKRDEIAQLTAQIAAL